MDGIPTTVLSVFGRTGDLPIWFRLWVGGDGLVRRVEMRAQGHFMDQRFYAFDAPLSIEAPVGPTASG